MKGSLFFILFMLNLNHSKGQALELIQLQDITMIPTERILPNPYQPRHRFESEDMLALANSIKENGILQPLLIRRINNSDYFEVIAGERRLRAGILANLKDVPCIVLDCDYEQSAVISILENVQRADLTFFEEATALGQLMNQFGLSQTDMAKRLGKSQSTLSNKIRLLSLPVDVRYFIEKEGLTERHARALLKLDNEKDIWTVLNVIKERKYNVEQTERYISSMVENKKPPKKTVIRVFKDVRIFVNTVNKAIETMRASGIDAQSDKTETEDYIEFRVKIPKNVKSA